MLGHSKPTGSRLRSYSQCIISLLANQTILQIPILVNSKEHTSINKELHLLAAAYGDRIQPFTLSNGRSMRYFILYSQNGYKGAFDKYSQRRMNTNIRFIDGIKDNTMHLTTYIPIPNANFAGGLLSCRGTLFLLAKSPGIVSLNRSRLLTVYIIPAFVFGSFLLPTSRNIRYNTVTAIGFSPSMRMYSKFSTVSIQSILRSQSLE